MTGICCICSRPHALPQTEFCLDCVADVREQVRCPDCDSAITVLVNDAGLHAHVAHDETCPRWLAQNRAGA